jgi:hypothetical protein
MAKMMMMMTFVKTGMMKLKTGLTYRTMYMNIQENKILHLNSGVNINTLDVYRMHYKTHMIVLSAGFCRRVVD